MSTDRKQTNRRQTDLVLEVTPQRGSPKKEDISNGRILFRHRSEMYESKGNYKQRYKDTNLLCDSCESEVDDYLHVLYCSSYKELRDGKSLKNDTDLAIYLKKVLRITTNLSLER